MGNVNALLMKSDEIRIDNKESILDDLDTSLGRKASIEYTFVRSFSQVRIPFTNTGFSWNAFGHSAIRYTTPKGEDVVMNVEAKTNPNKKSIIEFHKPSNYFFGPINPQGGIYKREFITIRLYNIPEENIAKMHQFYLDTRDGSYERRKWFSILFGPLYNVARKIFTGIPEAGNCARWTSKGLEHAGVIAHPFVWPKSILINLFENNPDADVVIFERIPGCESNYSMDVPKSIELVSPLQFIRSYLYADMRGFAHRRVVYSENDKKIDIIEQDPIYRPSPVRNVINNKYIIIGTSLLTSVLMYRFARNPRILFGCFRSKNTKHQ